jgi:hypothetical protein
MFVAFNDNFKINQNKAIEKLSDINMLNKMN